MIYAAGSSDGSFALARYSSSGALDPTFGDGRLVVLPAGITTAVQAIAVQSDGKILVAGTYGYLIMLVRYLPNGQLDPDFTALPEVSLVFVDIVHAILSQQRRT